MSRPPKSGEVFNPFRMFTGLFVPEALARCRPISGGAKLAYGRLVRYAGENGQCYPTVESLGNEIGVGVRQAQKYLSELERAKLIRRVDRYLNRGQTSNGYEFLWHEMFSGGGERSFGEGVNDETPRGVNDRSPKESQSEESHSEENQKRLRLTARDSQKTRFAAGGVESECAQYPRLREALASYMQGNDSDARIYPTDRQVVDVKDSALGASELEIIECLRYLRQERGLLPGSRHGPRHFSWFPTVVVDYFRRERDRQAAATPAGASGLPGIGIDKATFNSMTEAIEIEGSQWTA
jgi:Helix-turn-helix domain